MLYPEDFRRRAIELFNGNDESGEEGLSASTVLNHLREEFPGRRKYPVEDTIREWADGGEKPTRTKLPKQAAREFRRAYPPRDVVMAIDIYLKHLCRRVQYAPNTPYRWRIHPEPGPYDLAIIADIGRIDRDVVSVGGEFEVAVEAGNKDLAEELLNKLIDLLNGHASWVDR